jgi:2-oxoisovalerate dehydrogenase E2 component (dihydrolipoyl transacylase)
VKPFLLADIGEGITECQLIQWFVQPGARVEQFDKLCEVQSDKASVEITSPFDGVIKKLHYEPDDMAITGKPLVDIDIQGELSEADQEKLGGGETVSADQTQGQGEEMGAAEGIRPEQSTPQTTQRQSRGDKGSLATPAVRHLIKEHRLDINDITGTGRDGRVLKEDIHRHVSGGEQKKAQDQSQPHETVTVTAAAAAAPTREDRKVALTGVQNQMFKTMTRSLNIPHFLYSTTADMTNITALRKRLNASAPPEQKLTHLAFIMKALSMALSRHPLLNASLNTQDGQKPELTYKASHHFGIAIDTPSGLLVPVLKDVQALSIVEIGWKMRQLSAAARQNRLAPADFGGATFTVSNIGAVGGGVVSPVISAPQVGIVGIGRSKVVPAFDARGGVVGREELVFSWSADHRVVDGAECARCAERVTSLLEDPGAMLVELR